MIEAILKRVKGELGAEREGVPTTEYYISDMDGYKFWVSAQDYQRSWKGTSMLEMKRLAILNKGVRRVISLVALQTFQEPWQKEGTLDKMKEKGIQVVFTEGDKILETPLPQLAQ